MIIYKIDVLQALKQAGYSTYRIRQENIFGQRTVTSLKNGVPVSYAVLNKLCFLLSCNVGDILDYVPDND